MLRRPTLKLATYFEPEERIKEEEEELRNTRMPAVPTPAQYTKNLFLDSLVTGVPQILQAKKLPRKILKTLILMSSLIGFFYQTSGFLQLFWRYPTVLDISVEYPEYIEMPAITFCSLNGIKRTKFCAANVSQCGIPSNLTQFRKNFPEISSFIKNDFMFPNHEAYKKEYRWDSSELITMGHSAKDTLHKCERLDSSGERVLCSADNLVHMVMPDGNEGYRNCYTLFSAYNSTKLDRELLPVPKRKGSLIYLMLNIEQEEYFRPDRGPGVMISIHSPNDVANPYDDGFVASPGLLHTVHLKVVEEKLLPYPYETKCMDYKAAWNLRGGKGPLSQDTCLAECVYNASMEQCDCVLPNVMYYHQDPVCEERKVDDCFTYNVTKCYDICRQPCEFTAFEFEVQKRKLDNPMFRDLNEKDENILLYTQKKAIVMVYLKRPEKIVYSHRPQYEDIEVFSFVGGYMGMWLGVSLVAVCDFAESLILAIAYWLRKKLLC